MSRGVGDERCHFFKPGAGGRWWTELDAPSGFEEPVQREVRTQLASVCDQVEVDVRERVRTAGGVG
ncbi:MAG: hypothetical protein R3B90_19765 [Planctomycetaceae bacterium]